jgi:hypothetical protein
MAKAVATIVLGSTANPINFFTVCRVTRALLTDRLALGGLLVKLRGRHRLVTSLFLTPKRPK